MKSLKFLCLLFGCTLLFSGCAAFEPVQRPGVSSSLVDYLYPEGQVPDSVMETKPVLQLPLRVGLAFVPPSRLNADSSISEKQKNDLLEQVKAQFEQYAFIEYITVIPDNYLSRGRGFTTVEQVSRLYGVDIIALVSYDQVVFSKNNLSSLTYWTVVGAYIFPGDEQRVDTFVDTAVFDIRTHKLLFRAPGVDSQKDVSRLITVNAERTRISQESFAHAMTDMSKNLDLELGKFKERVKQGNVVDVKVRQGYSGGGSFDILLLIAVMLAVAGRLASNRLPQRG